MNVMDKVDEAIVALSIDELRTFVARVAETLYWDSDFDCWDPNKEWDAETLDFVKEQMPADIYNAVTKAHDGQAK